MDWKEVDQRKRTGLDLRDADLSQVNLSGLPLARMCCGLFWDEWLIISEEQRHQIPVRMEGADLMRAYLEGANLGWAKLNSAYFNKTQMQEIYLSGAQLEESPINSVQLEGANLYKAHLEGADLSRILLSDGTQVGPRLVDAHWSDANLAAMHWSWVAILADEYDARQKKHDGKIKDRDVRLHEYETY